jgi:hypothetical protein
MIRSPPTLRERRAHQEVNRSLANFGSSRR